MSARMSSVSGSSPASTGADIANVGPSSGETRPAEEWGLGFSQGGRGWNGMEGFGAFCDAVEKREREEE
jgi:hypothetical protein